MFFNSMSDFWAMGGYAAYVWSSYIITFGAMFILLVSSIKRRQRLLKNVTLKLERQARIDAAKDLENTL